MATPKPAFKGGEKYDSEYRHLGVEDLKKGLKSLYEEQKGSCRYFCHSVADGDTLSDLFADELITKAQPLLYASDSADLMASKQELIRELQFYIEWLKNGEKFKLMSPGIDVCLLPDEKTTIECLQRQIPSLLSLAASLECTLPLIERCCTRKPDSETLKSLQVDSYLESVYEIFSNHHLPFTAWSESSHQASTFALSVVSLVFQYIPGLAYAKSTLNKKIKEIVTRRRSEKSTDGLPIK